MFAFVVGLLVASAPGCRDDEAASPDLPLDAPWTPGNGEFDDSCEQGCEEFLELTTPHSGELDLRLATELDDPLAQWGECIGTFFACWGDEQRPVPECVQAATCPAACKAEFTRQVVDAEDEEQEIHAFNRVFVDDDAPCRAPDDDAPEASP
ncbi:MAG: hypothetical protein AAF799_12020 [Myxococcota bacterium]